MNSSSKDGVLLLLKSSSRWTVSSINLPRHQQDGHFHSVNIVSASAFFMLPPNTEGILPRSEGWPKVLRHALGERSTERLSFSMSDVYLHEREHSPSRARSVN